MNTKRPTSRRRRRRESGQVEVETAIVLPAVVFLLLGLIQLGLLHQARLMAKYAAFRAVRIGSVRVDKNKNNWIRDMEMAAVAASLPVLSWANPNDVEVLGTTHNADKWVEKWEHAGFGGHPSNKMQDVNMKYAEVEICGPLRNDVSGHTYTVDQEYVPFDHPVLAGRGIKTKLRIQLTLNYRMIIPFADWVFYYMYRGWKFTKDLHLGEGEKDAGGGDKYDNAAVNDKVYIIPLRVQYATKLHSDVPLNHLPSANNCL